ncbi:unnamed protein product, partial [Effrenium voratum]
MAFTKLQRAAYIGDVATVRELVAQRAAVHERGRAGTLGTDKNCTWPPRRCFACSFSTQDCRQNPQLGVSANGLLSKRIEGVLTPSVFRYSIRLLSNGFAESDAAS